VLVKIDPIDTLPNNNCSVAIYIIYIFIIIKYNLLLP